MGGREIGSGGRIWPVGLDTPELISLQTQFCPPIYEDLQGKTSRLFPLVFMVTHNCQKNSSLSIL